MFTVPKGYYRTFGFFLFSLLISTSDVASTDCTSETVVDRTGIIFSPTVGYPGLHYCKYWSIRAKANSTVTISFDFLNIQTEYDGSCIDNFVQLGPIPERTLCGSTHFPYIAQVKREHVWVSFKTNNLELNQFKLHYIVGDVPSRVPCYSRERTCSNGKCIPSEWWCNDYNECGDDSDETQCQQEVTTTYSRCGLWDWKCLNGRCIPYSTKCNGIDDCGDNSDEQHCTTIPQTYNTTTSQTTTSVPGCGHIYISDSFGRFVSPYFPGYYPNNLDCTWTIISESSHDRIQLNFTSFWLQPQRNTDYLAVYDGPNEHSPIKGIYYGGHLPPQSIESSSSSLFIKFHSDPLYKYRGFSVIYKTVEVTTTSSRCGLWDLTCSNGKCVPYSTKCNGIDDCGDSSDEQHCSDCGSSYLNNSFGHFSTPNYPGYFPNNADCSWTITSPNPNDKLQLHFYHFKFGKRQNTDYVSVYDGPNEHSPLKGVYYGANPPPVVIESSSNALFVKFHSDSMVTSQGFSASYQRKGVCMPGQLPCARETECYFSHQKCDGVWNCPEHGSDEMGCYKCDSQHYTCGPNTAKCYTNEERCNGNSFCLNNSDEKNCTSKRCGPHNGLFLCRNKRCIYQYWECDRTSDCDDHSDEDGCPSPFFTRRVIVAAVAGSLICSLLLVIALGCICKVYALRMHEQYGPRHESPLSRLQAEFFRRRAPPPPYHEAMLTSRPYEEARREYLNQSRDHRRRRSSDRRRNRALPPTPEEPSLHQIGTASSSGDPELGEGNDVQLHTLNSTNQQGANTDTSSTAELIPPTTSSDSEDNGEYQNEEEDDNDSVLLDITEGVGGTATWRSVSRNTSDEERSPEHAPSEGGCDSVDSASASISVDDVSLALHETLDKENGVEAEIVDKENSVDQEFPAPSQSSLSDSIPEEQFSTMEHVIKNQ